MCKEYRWVITIASLSGLIQSILWMALGITGILVYLCVVQIDPYKTPEDFFKVTFVKLYFEGPKGKLDGSYLGQFDKDYKNAINLFTQDLVFGVMVAIVILNAFYLVLSVAFYKKRKDSSKRTVALSWSIMNLILCVIDILFTYVMILDFLALEDYLSHNTLPFKFTEIPYIPLTLALLSSRFIAGWLWNFIFGFIILMDALCCRNIITIPPKDIKQMERHVEKPQKPEEQPQQEISVINRNHINSFDLTYQDYLRFKNSMETSTRFNTPEKQSPVMEDPKRGKSYNHPEAYWQPKPQPSKKWEMANEGYVSDEEEKQPDFDHDLRNFEPGQRKIKVLKPPIGKPVYPFVREPFSADSKEIPET